MCIRDRVVTEEVGLKLENIGLDLLGKARKIVVTKDETTVVEGAGTEADIKGRISQIKTCLLYTSRCV